MKIRIAAIGSILLGMLLLTSCGASTEEQASSVTEKEAVSVAEDIKQDSVLSEKTLAELAFVGTWDSKYYHLAEDDTVYTSDDVGVYDSLVINGDGTGLFCDNMENTKTPLTWSYIKTNDDGNRVYLINGGTRWELVSENAEQTKYKGMVFSQTDEVRIYFEKKIDTKTEEKGSINKETTRGEENALKKAEQYLDYTAFSYTGLIEQLKYEGFTESEATFAAENCGADWNEQAARKAEEYLNYSAFSKSGLIEQLEYEGFTHEQAVYGVNQAY